MKPKTLTVFLMMLTLGILSAYAAPTPTAVWEAGEFEKTKNGYSIVLNGNSIDAGGRIAIDSSAGNNLGAYIDVSGAGSKKATVLIKYSNLQPITTSNRSLASMYLELSPQSYDVGARTKSANTLPITGFTSGNSNTYDFTEEENVPSFAAGTGHIILAIDSDVGTSCYTGETLDSMSGGTSTGLKYESYTIRKIAVGGAYTNGKAYSWDGVKIEKVAIFIDETYTNDDLADYEWPNAQTPVLGEGITAYYDCETDGSSPIGVTVKGQKWNAGTGALAADDGLLLGWSGSGIGNRGGYGQKFDRCYSGGGTAAGCRQSAVCAGLCPGTTAGQDWSFSMWVVRSNASTHRRLFVNSATENILSSYGEGDISAASTANTGFGVYLVEGGKVGVRLSETTDGSSFGVASIVSSSAYTWNNATWHNILVTRSGDTLTLYVDGSEAGSIAMTADSYLVDPRCLTMAEGDSDGIGQENGADEFCVWNRALSLKEALAIADGASTIGAMAETIPTVVSLEENGGYATNGMKIVFKNVTLAELTGDTLSARFGGDWSGTAKTRKMTFNNFDRSAEASGTITCEAQVQNDTALKGLLLTFTQVGDDVAVKTTAAKYVDPGTMGDSLAAASGDATGHYAIYNFALPRTPQTDATIVWESGEFEMTKVGIDGNTYSFSSFGGLSVNSDGNLVIDTDNALGAVINLPDTSNGAATVLIKYSNLTANSTGNATLGNFKVYESDGTTVHYVGARTSTKNTLPLTPYYDSSVSAVNTGSTPSMQTGSGYYLLSYETSQGTHIYTGSTMDALTGGYSTGLKWRSSTISSVSIGGSFNHGVAYCWKGNDGTIIERVAIFLGEAYTASDLSNYYFPSAVANGYDNWDYATGMVTRSGSGELAAGTYKLFDVNAGLNTGTEYSGGSSYAAFGSSTSEVFWHYICYSGVSGVWAAPGLALRFSPDETSANKTIGGTFGPVQFGGMYVESGATGYSFDQGGNTKRDTILGDPTSSSSETWFRFEEPFKLKRTGTLWLSGTVNIELPESGDTLDLNSTINNDNPGYYPRVVATINKPGNGVQVTENSTTAGGTLKMHGAGYLTATKLVATGATLDFSDIGSRYNAATPFINCQLVIDGDTKFVFPKAVELPYTYKVATSITVNGDMPTYEYVDANGSVYAFELSVDEAAGTVTIPTSDEAKSVSLNLGTSRDTYAFPAGLTALKISATELLSEDGLFSLVIGEGLDANVIDLILTNQNGEEVTTDVTYSGDTLTATYAPTVSGKACWIDYEMTYVSGDSNKTGFENSGTDTTNLSSDSGITGDNAFNQDTGMLYTYAHPWRNMTGVNAYPASWTAVVRCTVPAYENAAIITFGTCNGGLIGLVAGNDPETQMKLVKTTGNSAFTVLSEMTVQNATTAQHVYVFSVEDNQTIKIYCDGEPVLNATYDAFTLGGGIQVGSVHGGVHSTGIVRFAKGESPANTLSETVQKAARIDCVRLFKTVLGPKAIEQLSVEFPAMKLYKATVPAGASMAWDGLGWTPAWDGGNEYSKIILTAAGAATVTMPEKITAEDFTINAADGTTLSLVGDNTILAITNPIEVNGGAVRLSGTMEANVEITGELAVEGLTLAGDGTLTLDGAITATGAVTLQDKASVAIKSGATINVTSGLFEAVATTFTLGPKTMATDNEDGTYTFEVAKAQIGETRYNTVAAAIAAFTDHDTVLEVLDDTYDPESLEEQGIFWDESTRTYSYAAATIGTAYFPTLEAALSAASSGEDKSVTLFKNDTGATIAIPAGVALKLGGCTIAATPTTVDGYVIGITEGDTVYTSITNDATEWVGGASGNWSVYSNWSTGAVPGANTVVTIPEGTFTIGISDYDSAAHKCARMIVDGTATFAYSRDGDYWPELTLYGDISGSGKIIIRRAGLRNVSGSPVTIACAFGVEYNDTTDDSLLRGDNFNIAGNMTVDGCLKIEEGTTAIATGVATLGNGANIRALNTAALTIAELVAPDGVTATMGTSGSGTLTVAKMTGAGDVTFTNCTIAQLDDYTGTLGGTLSIGTVNVTAIDPEARLVKMSAGCTISNLAETTVTQGGNPTEYRLYAKEDGLYVKTALAVFRSAATGGWLDANSWTNANGETVGWTTDYLMYANIDAGQIESIDIGESDSVEMAKLTITGAETSSVTLTIDGTIAIDQELDLSGMAGTIVKDGAGKFTAKGDNSGATLYWTVEAGTLSLGGEFDSIGGNGTVVTMNGGTLDIEGAHGGSTVKKLVMNGDGAGFTNSAVVDATYIYYQSFPFPQIEVKADCSFNSDSDLDWGAIAASGEAWIAIDEGKTFTKTGAGKFYISNMAITGKGTLKVLEGVLDKGGACTVDNLEIENWSNIAGGGSITVNKRLIINNGADATVKLSERSMAIADNATVELKNAGTLDVGTWRANNYVLKVPTTGGKIQVTLSGLDEMELELAVAGLDESDIGNVILKDSGGNDVSGTYTLKRSGNTIRIVRSVKCMVANPVTGEHVAVKYAFTGATDSTWEEAGNWNEAYSDYSDWSALSDTTVPALPGSNKWSPLLFDGDLVQNGNTDVTLTDPLEGWVLKLAAVNGAHVNVATLNKFQGGCWIMADAASSVNFAAWGTGNNGGSLKYYVTGQDGVTLNMEFNRGNEVEYYFAGNGSVNYAAGVTAGTHSIKQATIELGTGAYKAIMRKALVKYSASGVSFDADEIEVKSDSEIEAAVRKYGALIGTEDVGTYAIVEESDGVYIEYIGHSATAPVEYVISGNGSKAWSWGETAPGESDTVTIKLNGNMALDLGDDNIKIGRLVVKMDDGATVESATLTLSGATLTASIIIIGDPVSVVAGKADQLAGALQGDGLISYTGFLPSGLSYPNGWTGTVWLKNQTVTALNLNDYGNSDSVVKVTGLTGYFQRNSATVHHSTLDLADDGETPAFTYNNGWGGSVVQFDKLTGDGTLKVTNVGNGEILYFADANGFAGTLNTVAKKIIFGGTVPSGDGQNHNGKLEIGNGATITIASGKVWTMNNGVVNNGTLHLNGTLSGALTNNGTLYLGADLPDNTVNNGTVVLLADDLNVKSLRDFAKVEVGAGVTQVQVNQIQSEYLNGFTEITGVPEAINIVRVNKFNGVDTLATKVGDGGIWRLEEEIQTGGIAALYDFTFDRGHMPSYADPSTNVVKNLGSAGGYMTVGAANTSAYDAIDTDTGNLISKTRPFVDNLPYPSEYTAVVYGTMPTNAYNVLIAFGSTASGYIALTRGEGLNDARLIYMGANASNPQELAVMRAKTISETEHLYVFTKTADTISVYLDGTWVTTQSISGRALGNALQIGRAYGGGADIANWTSVIGDSDPSRIEVIRIYGEVIGDAVMTKLVGEFPFVDAASDSERTLDAEDGRNSWYGEEIGTWTNTPDDVEDAGHLPRTNANVTLTVEGDVEQRIDVVLNANTVDEPNIIGDLHITGSQALTIRKSIGGHPVSVSGILTNDVSLTVHYGAIDLAYTALYMGEDATLTFELSELINDKRDSDRVYLTGVCDNFGTERVTYSYDTTADTFIKFKSLGWDSETRRYYVDFKSPRAARDVWFDPIPGADVTNVLSMAIEVYYTDGTGTKTSPILTGDTLHFKAGDEAVVQVPAGEMKLVGYDIPADVTVIFDEMLTNRVTGAGTIIMAPGRRPKADDSPAATSLKSSTWTGTLVMEGVYFEQTKLNNFGNANSTIRLIGCSINNSSANSYEVESTLELANGSGEEDGSGEFGLDIRGLNSSGGATVTFKKLVGTGALINTNTTSSAVNYLRIKDTSDFSGAITNLVGASGGVTMLFGNGDAEEGSIVVTADTTLKVHAPIYASTNLVVKGILSVADPAVAIKAKQVLFGTTEVAGVLSITDPEAYLFFDVESKITGELGFSLNALPDGVSPSSIQVMRVNEISYLPDEENIKLAAGKADDYALFKDADGRGWSLVRKGFYIRIR